MDYLFIGDSIDSRPACSVKGPVGMKRWRQETFVLAHPSGNMGKRGTPGGQQQGVLMPLCESSESTNDDILSFAVLQLTPGEDHEAARE
jgi:hypothetical protein